MWELAGHHKVVICPGHVLWDREPDRERVTDTPFTFLKIVKNLKTKKATKVSKELNLRNF